MDKKDNLISNINFINLFEENDNMVETFVFGHKSPDSDSITSSLVMANLENELGNDEDKAYRLGNINKET